MKSETPTYAEMGIAALLPGMQHMLTLMQGQLDEMRATLANLQNGGARKKKLGRPPGTNAKSSASGWPADPEERSREMKRRMAVAAEKKAQPSALSIARKKAWAGLSVRDRKRRIAAMQAGKKKPTVKLEALAS
jgi:hypothetical protein